MKLRRVARIYSLQFLYNLMFSSIIQKDYSKCSVQEVMSDLRQDYHEFNEVNVYASNLDENNYQFAKNLISLCLINYSTICNLIDKYSHSRRSNKIAKIDLSILVLSIAEMLYYQLTPRKVVIDEACELAKEFSEDDSRAFINGILDKI